MSLVAWIVVGFLAGTLAGAVTGRKAGGCVTTTLVGVLGALLGGLLFNAAGERGIDDFGLWSIFVAFVGAAVLLLLFGGVRRR